MCVKNCETKCLHCTAPVAARGCCQYHYSLARNEILSGAATDDELVTVGWILPSKRRFGFRDEMHEKLRKLRSSNGRRRAVAK